MNKRYLHHLWTKLRPINPVYFLALGIVCGMIFVLAYRQNYLHMTKFREAVYAADKSNGDVETALRNLRGYVYQHMNTDLTPKNDAIYPPIQLKYRYERLVETERERVKAQNITTYAQATALCEARFPLGLANSGRVPCIQEYVQQHGAKELAIPEALYKFDFVSPRWSPDLAGWMLLLTLGNLLLAATIYASDRWLKSTLRE